MEEFNGKVFVITGAAGGVGTIVTQQVAATGAKLALWDHAQDKLNDLKTKLPDSTACVTVAADLTDEQAVADAVSQTVAAFGQIDHLLHIAGGFAMPGPVHEGHLDTWHKMIARNATATYLTCGTVAKHMLDRKSGTITLVAARGGLKGGKNAAAYAASKAAALRIMESMSEELKHEGIRVNAISPSTIDTPANRDAMGDANASKWVTPQEIADTMLFLASSKASAITGANVEVYKRA